MKGLCLQFSKLSLQISFGPVMAVMFLLFMRISSADPGFDNQHELSTATLTKANLRAKRNLLVYMINDVSTESSSNSTPFGSPSMAPLSIKPTPTTLSIKPTPTTLPMIYPTPLSVDSESQITTPSTMPTISSTALPSQLPSYNPLLALFQSMMSPTQTYVPSSAPLKTPDLAPFVAPPQPTQSSNFSDTSSMISSRKPSSVLSEKPVSHFSNASSLLSFPSLSPSTTLSNPPVSLLPTNGSSQFRLNSTQSNDTSDSTYYAYYCNCFSWQNLTNIPLPDRNVSRSSVSFCRNSTRTNDTNEPLYLLFDGWVNLINSTSRANRAGYDLIGKDTCDSYQYVDGALQRQRLIHNEINFYSCRRLLHDYCQSVEFPLL